MLRPADAAVLDELGLPWAAAGEAGFTVVTIREFRLPAGLEPERATLLLQLPPGFPDAAPDMFWFDPGVFLTGHRVIPGTEATQTIIGQTWQRWSRHIREQWRPGIDNLATYLAYIRRCLDHATEKVA